MQKTSYEMRISDWSSYVCSSDRFRWRCFGGGQRQVRTLSFQIDYQVRAVLGAAEARERHLGARGIFARALHPFVHAREIPVARNALERRRIVEARDMAVRLAERTPQIRPDAVGAALVVRVACDAFRDHQIGRAS